MNPSWSPDSKWVAYAAHLNSLYKAIYVSNVETGEATQITDGLADTTWPVWDASGKYLWFLASTDFGMKSQWLDMTSYDHNEEFGLYMAVLKKGEPSPLLPESDEDMGVGSPGPNGTGGGAPRGGRGGAPAANGGADTAADQTQPAPRGPRGPVNVQIDFDGLPQRIISVPGVPVRQYSELRAGAPGTVYYLESGGAAAGARGAAAAGGGGNDLYRYCLAIDAKPCLWLASRIMLSALMDINCYTAHRARRAAVAVAASRRRTACSCSLFS